MPLPGMPATQGENNADICKELGFSDQEIKTMENEGVLVGNFTAQMIAMVSAKMAQQQKSPSHE